MGGGGRMSVHYENINSKIHLFSTLKGVRSRILIQSALNYEIININLIKFVGYPFNVSGFFPFFFFNTRPHSSRTKKALRVNSVIKTH